MGPPQIRKRSSQEGNCYGMPAPQAFFLYPHSLRKKGLGRRCWLGSVPCARRAVIQLARQFVPPVIYAGKTRFSRRNTAHEERTCNESSERRKEQNE